MCGIVGAFALPGTRHEWLVEACRTLQHRGPDGRGIWAAVAAGAALGHTRLAIQDLTDAGAQPMLSADERYCITFNGEIYNHLALRDRLPPVRWRGHSDTETIVECVSHWGFQRTLESIVGQFAIAVFDTVERRLLLTRDRFGEKPLYYGYAGPAFVFASELRAVRHAPQFDATIDRGALALFMQHSYVPAPRSIHVSMRKVPPGAWLEIDASRVASRSLPEPREYWSSVDVAREGERSLLALSDTDAIAELERTLTRAVKGQMLSDVPLGAFLSGGIDSSLVVSLMQAVSSRPVRTFSIGFEEGLYDESAAARRVAAHLGTEHTELVVRDRDALAIVPNLAQIFDEPFGDSSQVPTFLVSQLARRQVTVALSGDGGDELFGGYTRYFLGSSAWARLQPVPRQLRRVAAAGVRAVPTGAWDVAAQAVKPVMPSSFRVPMPGDKLHKAADVLECRDAPELYRRLTRYWWGKVVVAGAGDTATVLDRPWPEASSYFHQMMMMDAITYLPDDILAKVDRAAMAVSLETRVPLLDPDVYALAWRLPFRMKVRDGRGKWILRQLLHRYVPAPLVERPKQGFAIPLGAWLRGELRDWAEPLLNESRLRSEGYLDASLVRQAWREHVSGKRNWQYELWNVLMFEAWLDANR
jgi:asparagine synthase (glutamine-hydrolysing)